MTADKEQQRTLRRTLCRRSNNCAATAAARAAHERSSEKFSRLCDAAAKFRNHAELGAQRNEWVSYAAELRNIERSLQADLRSVNLLLLRILSETDCSETTGPPDSGVTKASEVSATPERQNATLEGTDSCSQQGGTLENKRSRELPALQCGICHEQLSRAGAGEATLPAAQTPGEEAAELTDEIAELRALSEACVPTALGYTMLASREQTRNRLGYQPPAMELSAGSPPDQHPRDDNAQVQDILWLKCCAKALAESVASCLTAGENPAATSATAFNAASPAACEEMSSGTGGPPTRKQHTDESTRTASPREVAPWISHDYLDASAYSFASLLERDSSTTSTTTTGSHVEMKYCGVRTARCSRGASATPKEEAPQRVPCAAALSLASGGAGARAHWSDTHSDSSSDGPSLLATTPSNSVEHSKQPGLGKALPREEQGTRELHSVVHREIGLQRTGAPQQPKVLREHADIRAKQTTDLHANGTQQRCPCRQEQDERGPLPRTLAGRQHPSVKHLSSCERTEQLPPHIAELALLLRKQYAVQDRLRRELELEERSAEVEICSMRRRLHHLLTGRARFSSSAVRPYRSTANMVHSADGPAACAGGCALSSTLCTRSDSDAEGWGRSDSLRHSHSSGGITDEEEDLMEELTKAGSQQSCASPAGEQQKSLSGDHEALMKLRGKYVNELEQLETELEDKLRAYNQEAGILQVEQQSLLGKACGGGGSEALRQHEEGLDALLRGGSLRGSQERCGLTRGLSTLSSFSANESGADPLRGGPGCPCVEGLCHTADLERDSGADHKKLQVSPGLRSTRSNPVMPTVPGCHQRTPECGPLEAVVDTTSTASDLKALVVAVRRGNTESHEVGSTRKTASSPSSLEDRCRALALLRYTTTEFQHSESQRMQHMSCTLMEKLKLIFPNASSETLRKLLNIDKQLLLLQHRRAATLWRFSRKRQEALRVTREELRNLGVRREELVRRQELHMQQRRRREILQKLLDAQRRRAEEQQLALRKAAEAHAVAQNAREAQRARREQQQREENKRLIAERHEARAAARKQEELEAAAAQKREAIERAARARRYRHRLLRRRQEEIWKSRMYAQARQYETLRRAQVIERLLRVAAKHAIQAPADPLRVQQPTCASQARAHQTQAERQEVRELHGQGRCLLQGRSACFAVPHGYSVDKLFLDMRLRLSTALHEAGLAQTRAAREALLGVGANAVCLAEGAT